MSKYSYSFDPEDTNNTAAAVYRLALTGGPRVLDLGSGPGVVSSMLATVAGRTVTCADSDTSALAEARAGGVQETVAIDLRDPEWFRDLPGRGYDVVILADVLEHLVEPELVLRALQEEKIVAPDGVLVISYPNMAHESIIIELMTGNFEYTETGLLDATHLRFFTRSSMQSLLESTGYLVTETHRTRRTAEQTPHRSRALELDAELRKVVGELGDDAKTYQYVVLARPSTEAVRISLAEQRLNDEHAAHLSALEEIRRLSKQLDDLRGRQRQLDEEFRRTQDSVEQERLDAIQAREALRRADEERKKLQTQLNRVARSNTYRAGKLVRYMFRPAEGFRALNRRRARSAAKRGSAGGATGTDANGRDGGKGRGGDVAKVPRHFRDLMVDPALRTAYEQAARVEEFRSDRPKVAFCVSTADLDAGRGDLYVAIGIGRYLERHGYEVAYLPTQRWAGLPAGTDIAVAMIPTFDPLTVPDGCRVIAWIRNETDRWSEHPHLALFDTVITSSSTSLSRIREHYDGPTGLLPLGVDTELFTLPAEASRVGATTTVNSWGRERHLYQCLRGVDIDFPFVIFGERRGMSPHFTPYAVGSTSYFTLPDLYRRSLLVLDDLNHTTRPYGNVNSRLMESLAAGALPLTNSRVGLQELGLDEVPTYHDAASLGQLLAQLTADPAGTAARAGRLAAAVRDRHSYARRAEELHQVIVGLDPQPRRVTGRFVGSFPNYVDNPYQAMLMSGLRDAGVQSFPVTDVLRTEAPHLPSGPLDNYVLHVHWTDPILHPARSGEEAMARLAEFQQRVAELRARGGRLVWTIHNVFPHEWKFPAAERALARFLADEADAVHVLSEETLAAVEPHYPLDPDKVRVIRHSSYLGVYPNSVSRVAARERFGLEPDQHVVLFFGGIRPYKGVDVLLDSFAVAARRDARLRLIVAGPAKRLDPKQRLKERCEADPKITPVFGAIPNEEIQFYFKAADTVVLPYRSILNSGIFHLAISFGRPVIAPRVGSLTSLLDPEFAIGFDPTNQHALAEALLAAPKLRGRHVELAALSAARGYQFTDMGRDYAKLITELFDTPGR
ncbi:methyltransferase domain-containing protein [Solwaraspora sp. WMMD406]|uniref:methyltransferase domain-containing protein n=1 Tax=Solwaraspora sp. WMMD406 TaxID=3016095 RepID=UPI002417A6AC|nr:methyltransferase domain-containing protein [Solwaraspora sp. WMMD406]MDG4763557.1 methyltransferase domain-containing protein [Solwaraspora sp. WMMD406]